MEQKILKPNYYQPLNSNPYPVTSFEFDINIEERRMRFDSSESSQDTSGYSSIPRSGDDRMSNSRKHSPFFGRFTHQNFNASQQPVSKGYDSYLPIQMEPENNKFNLQTERQQNKNCAGMLHPNKELRRTSIDKLELSDHKCRQCFYDDIR